MDKINTLITEQVNASSKHIDQLETEQILQVINSEDQTVPIIINQAIPQIAKATNLIVNNIRNGGRLFYFGAGTSGRIGILDASECPPTFGTSPELIQGVIAGGSQAILTAVEGAEDSEELGLHDVEAHEIQANDTVVGIAASGRTPYILGVMRRAREAGATVIGVCNNHHTPMSELAHVVIEAVVGPEVIMGSTRMKAGTAQKLILNMLSTAVMIRLGKVYGNLMVDLQASNQKLVARSKRIIQLATNASDEKINTAFTASNGHAKTAITMILANVDANLARQMLANSKGSIREAVEGKAEKIL